MFVSKGSEPQLCIIMGLRWYTLHGRIAGIEAFVIDLGQRKAINNHVLPLLI